MAFDLARRIRYRFRRAPKPQTCKDCWKIGGLDFDVPDEVWSRVIEGASWLVPSMGRVTNPALCLECFDRRAEVAGIDYGHTVSVLGCKSWMAGIHD